MEGITITHEHPLIFNEDEKALGDDEVFCKGCEKPISSGPWISCAQCEFFVHKACAELPQEIQHSTHPRHRLILHLSSPYGKGIVSCNACGEECDGFVYHCSNCSFDLDIICAFEERELAHASHHHPLLLLQREMNFKCDACFMGKSDCCYLCATCQYCIHKSCAKLPSTISVAEHDHPLTLVYSIMRLTNFFLRCDICRKEVPKSYWNYFCHECQFVAHLNCATEPRREESEEETKALQDPNLLGSLPLITDLDFIKHFITNNEYVTNLWSCPDPGHGLSFHCEPPKANSSKIVKLICDACVLPISTPLYCCTPHTLDIPRMRSSCNYFLHEVCSRLPDELIQHPCHPQHPLLLNRPTSFYELFKCHGCNRWTNGFFYHCNSCNFNLDIKCASLPTTILHDAHKHPLVQSDRRWNFDCDACGNRHSEFRFRCESCKYNVAFKCVTSSRFVRHRWDDHPLSLICSTRIPHPQEFICDICEVEINRQYWFYHCIECDNTFHPLCMPQYDDWSNVKFGGILQHKKHPHPLAFRRRSKIRHMVECKCCHEVLEGGPIFECTQGCDLRICRPCIASDRWK